MSDRRTSAPAPPAPIQVSSSALAHQAAVRFYNDQLKRQAAAKGLNTANLPYAAPTTAPDDLMTLARRNGVDFGGSAPAEQGLHSGSGAVDPFNRPKPSTSQPQSQQTSSTGDSASITPSQAAGIATAGLNPLDPSSALTSAVLTPTAAPSRRFALPAMNQLVQTPLPPDVAQTVLAQRQPAPPPRVSGDNIDTAQAFDDYARGKMSAGQLGSVYDAASAMGNQQAPAYQPATVAADAASRRQPGGSPYGLVPVPAGQSFDTYISDGQTSFNGKVYPAGTPITLGPNGKKIIGTAPAAQPSTPTSTASAPASAPVGHVAATLGSSYPTTPQGVAAADRNAQASPAGGAPPAQLPAWIAGMTDPATLARGGASAPASTAAPATAPSGSASPGTAAALAVRADIGNAGQAIGDTLNSARDSVRNTVDTAASNTADFGSTLLGLPSASPATRNAGVDAVNAYAANNPSVAYLAKPPVATQAATPSNMAGGYNLSAYGLKPPGTAGTAVASNSPVAPSTPGYVDSLLRGFTGQAQPGFDANNVGRSFNADDGYASGYTMRHPIDTVLGLREDVDPLEQQANGNSPAPAAPQPAAPPSAPATGSPSIVANKGLLANAGIGTGTPLPSATSTNPLFVPTPSPQVNVNGTPASLAAAPTAAQTLANAPSASQNLARPGFQTNTGGVVSDTDEALNRRTDADQALNPDKPPGSVTPGTGNSLLNAGSNLMPGYVDQMRNQAASLDSPSPLTLGNTATNNGSTSLNGQPPADHVSSVLGDYATPAGVAQSGPGSPSLTPRTTVPNPGVVGATPTDPNTPLGDDEEIINGVRRKKLQSSTSPAPPAPSTASTNSSAPAAPSGSDS